MRSIDDMKPLTGYLNLYGPEKQYEWKTHSTSMKILVDENTPPGHIDFVNMANLKNKQFKETIKREMARSLYGP